jgi:predicted ester cyclase
MGSLRPIVEQHYRDIADKDWERMANLFSPDVITVMPGAEPLKGIQPFLEYAQVFMNALPDAHTELKSTVEEGNTIVAEANFIGTHTGPLASPQGEVPPTGKSVNFAVSDVFEVQDGKVIAHRVYFDRTEMMAQLGLLPEPAQA